MKNAFLFIVFIAVAFRVGAQVKIGDNSTLINENSILELESTNKGFLPPRVALNSISSPVPLTATVTEGMLVYSDGGTLADGYYYWSGTKWLAIASSSVTRDNFVLVKSLADFPAPVGGIITLVAGVLSEISLLITNCF